MNLGMLVLAGSLMVVNPTMSIDAIDGVEVEPFESTNKGEKYEVSLSGVDYEYYINGDCITLLPISN